MRRGAEFEDIHLGEYGGHSPYLSINRLIESDINNYYADPFPDLEALLSDVSLRSYYFGWYQPSELHLYILENGFHQYLNQKHPELKTGEVIEEDGFRLTPYSLQLDDNSMPEWLIQFESLVFQARIFLLFDQTEDGQYELVSSSLPTFLGRSYSDGWVELILDKDFTGDGINEIVIDSTTVWSGFTERTWDVFTWDGELINLDQIVDTSHADFETADQDGDGLNDMQVTTHYSSRFGCAWEAVDLYRWPNQIAQHTLSDHEEPDTAVCNLSQAVTPFSLSWNPEKDDQYPLLERAVNQFRENPEAVPDLLAYALSQLAMTYLERGLDSQARQTIDSIYQITNESTYIQYIQEHDEGSSVIDICRGLVAYEDQVLETSIGDYLTEAGFLRGRGMQYIPYKPAICDLKYTGLVRVRNTNLPATVPPAQAMADLNLQYAFAQVANLDDDPDLEWIGILEPEAPWLVIFDAENGQWVAHFVDDIFTAPVFDLDFGQQKITNDDNLSILVTIAAESYSTWTTTETEYEVFLIDKVDQEYVIVDTNHLYDEQPDLKDLPDDFFNLDSEQSTIIEPGWKQLEDFLEEPEYIGFYIENLTDSILAQTDPTIPEKITQLLNYLPTDDPDAQPYIEHLTYLLGYFYELSGDEENAVSTYLELIQQYPTSPWSWLAWARLEPVEG